MKPQNEKYEKGMFQSFGWLLTEHDYLYLARFFSPLCMILEINQDKGCVKPQLVARYNKYMNGAKNCIFYNRNGHCI